MKHIQVIQFEQTEELKRKKYVYKKKLFEQQKMKKEQEILILRQKLTEQRLLKKMHEWTFHNAKNLTETKVNAILDEVNRATRAIEAIEARLKELED